MAGLLTRAIVMTTSCLAPADDSPALSQQSDADSPRFTVLHLINGQYFAGAEKVQDLLAIRLPEHGFDVEFACVRPDRFPDARQSTVPLHRTPMSSRFDLRPAWRLARIMRHRRCSLLHTHTPRAALIGHAAAWIAGVPLVHHMHGQTSSELTRRRFGRFSAMVERWCVRHARCVIAVSPSLRRHLVGQGISEQRIKVVYNGVPEQATVVRRGSSRDVWTIGTVGLLRPRKGIEVLLQSVARLRAERLPVRLRLIGPTETDGYAQRLRDLASQLKIESYVDWVGFVSDVNQELSRLDVMVLPSLLAEGLPMVVIEAMAAGVPVVGTRVDGTADVIRSGDNGLLAEPDDVESLTHQLSCLVRGQAEADGLRARAKRCQRESFSDRSMAAGVAAVYQQVLALNAAEFGS
jgi:glycosyltransferase involved in cell wall biosynthesis